MQDNGHIVINDRPGGEVKKRLLLLLLLRRNSHEKDIKNDRTSSACQTARWTCQICEGGTLPASYSSDF